MSDNNHEINDLILRELRETRGEVNRLSKAITGDPDLGHIGLVHRIVKLEVSDEQQNKKWLVLSSATAALSSAATIVVTYFKDKLFGS